MTVVSPSPTCGIIELTLEQVPLGGMEKPKAFPGNLRTCGIPRPAVFQKCLASALAIAIAFRRADRVGGASHIFWSSRLYTPLSFRFPNMGFFAYRAPRSLQCS